MDKNIAVLKALRDFRNILAPITFFIAQPLILLATGLYGVGVFLILQLLVAALAVLLYYRLGLIEIPVTAATPSMLMPQRPVPQPPATPAPRFIDRYDEQGNDMIERATSILVQRKLLTLWGSGGTGKTTLGLEIANRLFPAYFSGGVVWDTADGHADFGLINLLDAILTAYGREDARSLAPDAKGNLARHLLNDAMPCLLGLDNFETIKEEQKAILAFFEQLPCPVLVTSRASLPIGESIHVGPMTAQEAEKFLTSLGERPEYKTALTKVDKNRIADVAERNPMLMRWVVAQLVEAMRPQDVFDEIARGKGEAAERIFGRSFAILGPDGQTALLALFLFVPDASREALAVVCDFEKDRTNTAIRRLAQLDLIEANDRIRVVALTRRLTKTQLEKDQRADALSSGFADHFLTYAQSHAEITPENIDALDTERENLLAAVDYAYALAAWQTVMDLVDIVAIPGLLYLRGYWDEAIKRAGQAAEAAREAKDVRAIAVFTRNSATIYYMRADYTKAEELLQKSLEIAKQIEDLEGIASILDMMASIARSLGDYTKAQNLYQQSLDISNKVGNLSGIATTLHNMAIIAQRQGDYNKALYLYQKSLNIEAQQRNLPGIATSLHQMGRIAQELGDYPEAEELFRQSLDIFKQLGDQAGIASILNQLGVIAEDQGHYPKAQGLHQQSLEIRRQLGDLSGIAMSLFNLGLIAQHQGDYQKTRDLYLESQDISKRIGDKNGIAKSLHQMGRLAEIAGSKAEAAELFRESLNIWEQLESPEAETARRSLKRIADK